MAVPMSKRLSERGEEVEAPAEIVAHGDGWRDVPYIRRDIYESELAERDAMLAAALTQRATVLNVQPGDVLVAHVSQPMPFEAVDRLRQSLLIHLRPFGLHDVIVLNAVDSLTVVRKGEGNA